jgi:Type II secretion system (T2SS), protein G
LLYAHQNNRLPVDLAAIPELPGYDNSTSDAWGRPLHYEINENNTVTLKSYGQDGLPGGSGQNADIVLSFATHRPDGGWSDQLVNWLEELKPVSQDQP